MSEDQDRVEQFRTEISAMGLRDPATRRDRSLLRVGAALLVVGPVLTIIAYATSTGTRDPLEQSDAQVLAIIGLTITVAGAALFVRYSMAHFLRFWLARLSFEQAAQTDRVVDALADKS
jgi:ABC-type sulfate transport system permease component